MRKLFISLLLLPFLYTAAMAQAVIIQGTIKSDTALHGKIYMSFPLNGVLTRDSAEIKSNKYRFEVKTPDAGLRCVITWSNKRMIADTVVKKYFAGWAEAGKITSFTHNAAFKEGTVLGSDLNTDVDRLQMEMKLRKRPRDVIAEEYILKHPSSWLSFMLIRDELKQRLISPETGLRLYRGLGADLRKYEEVAKLGEQIGPKGKTAIGNSAIEFTIDDVNGNPIALSSFRGKFVLIDFWASWCGPCRAENPNLIQAWKTYRDRGFDILGVSLDVAGQKQAWLDAIKKDGIGWTQVSDLKGMKSDIAVAYNLSAIPANFLIDPSGNIVAKDLRGEELQKKLKDLLQ